MQRGSDVERVIPFNGIYYIVLVYLPLYDNIGPNTAIIAPHHSLQ